VRGRLPQGYQRRQHRQAQPRLHDRLRFRGFRCLLLIADYTKRELVRVF